MCYMSPTHTRIMFHCTQTTTGEHEDSVAVISTHQQQVGRVGVIESDIPTPPSFYNFLALLKREQRYRLKRENVQSQTLQQCGGNSFYQSRLKPKPNLRLLKQARSGTTDRRRPAWLLDPKKPPASREGPNRDFARRAMAHNTNSKSKSTSSKKSSGTVNGYIPLFGERSKKCDPKLLLCQTSSNDGNSDTNVDNAFDAGYSREEEKKLYEQQLAALARQVQRLKVEAKKKVEEELQLPPDASEDEVERIKSLQDGEEPEFADLGLEDDLEDDIEEDDEDEEQEQEHNHEGEDEDGVKEDEAEESIQAETHIVEAVTIGNNDDDINSHANDNDNDNTVGETDAVVEVMPCLRGPKLFYKTDQHQWLSIYRDILPDRGERDVRQQLLQLHHTNRWGFFLMRGGHFAAAIVEEGKFVRHKCYHRYVVRAKRGTVQSVQDAKQKASQSAGAGLRRHNEVALASDIQALVTSWQQHLQSCSVIFVQVPMAQRPVLFGLSKGAGKGGKKEGVLSKSDPRIRSIPFPTARPTMQEIAQVYAKLAGLYREEGAPPAITTTPTNNKVSEAITTTTTTTTKKKQIASAIIEPEGVQAHYVDSPLYLASNTTVEQLQLVLDDMKTTTSSPTTSISNNDVGVDNNNDNDNDNDINDVNYAWNTNGETALHAAAHAGLSSCVKLLLEAGVNPVIFNERGQTPFEVAPDKETRNAFRRFMALEPDLWDYEKAKIPSPLSAEMEEKQIARDKAQKKKAKDNKKKREKQKAAAALAEATRVEKIEEEEKKKRDEFLEHQRREAKITPRDRAAAAAMKRFELAKQTHASSTGCSFCGGTIGKNACERFQFKYCSPKCLSEHTPAAMAAQK